MFGKLLRVILVIGGLLLADRSCYAQTLHAVVVGDQSEAAGWGKYLPNIQMDLTTIFAMLTNNVPDNQLDYQPLTIEDEEGTPNTVIQHLKGIRVRPSDTLLFYFTGHGANDDRGHYFVLPGGKLYREQVRQAMLAKGARLSVIISDCCNARSDGQAYFAPMPYLEPPATVTPLFQSLFFQPRGEIDVNSCSPGESAFFTPNIDQPEALPGSLFTKAFTSYVDQLKNSRRSWDQLLRSVSMRVHLAFRESYPGGATVAKGIPRQNDQNVYAISYPGMPRNSGPRTGLNIRDHGGTGALITQVRPDWPASQVYDLTARRYTALRTQQVIVIANGKRIRSAADFLTVTKSSPQVMRLTIRDARGDRECLMRLRY